MRATKNNWLHAILFSILGLTLSFGAQAGDDNKDPKTVKREVKVLSLQSWDLNGSNPQNASHYVQSSPSTACDGIEQICQIQAPADLVADPSGNTPDLNATVSPGMTVLDYIRAAENGLPNEFVSKKRS